MEEYEDAERVTQIKKINRRTMENQGIINGNPTKIFFINMLTRDISLNNAIIDLIDNSVDGANRLKSDGNFKDLWVRIVCNENEFIIEDNCGGFSLEIARKYAFRFGRPEDAPNNGGSVGRFGVGMKRALFKMGKEFEVESKSEADHYQVDVNVDKWREKTIETKTDGKSQKTEDWSFNYTIINDKITNLNEEGTYVKVSNLYPDVSSAFQDDEFLNKLRNDIEKTLNFSLESGLKITINDEIISHKNITVFEGDTMPYFHNFSKNNVEIKIYAGLSHTGKPNDAGWYIYCNKRLVLEKDQSDITGWGVGSINQFHHKYAMFRGIVFFVSDNTLNLPLTTTKKGIDATSEVYKAAKVFMKEALLQIQNFLKEVDKMEVPDDYRKEVGEVSIKTDIVKLVTERKYKDTRKFVPPPIEIDKLIEKENKIRISFKKERDIAEKVKLSLDSKSYKEAGEKIFDYYVKMEEID